MVPAAAAAAGSGTGSHWLLFGLCTADAAPAGTCWAARNAAAGAVLLCCSAGGVPTAVPAGANKAAAVNMGRSAIPAATGGNSKLCSLRSGGAAAAGGAVRPALAAAAAALAAAAAAKSPLGALLEPVPTTACT